MKTNITIIFFLSQEILAIYSLISPLEHVIYRLILPGPEAGTIQKKQAGQQTGLFFIIIKNYSNPSFFLRISGISDGSLTTGTPAA